ncbi:MAG: zinc ribbon domain-containing protein [Gemmatimonadota bacterium]|nr:zinc ribbon domain-containing protein [Gemmatimonadota bacterium]MDH5805474.1 zinc ribbon domain-containing protein [Gemmatimonadota bacterium]
MPTYAYTCPKCGHEYDKLQKMSDTSPAPCPQCGAQGDRMISGGAGVVFKGSGFYETDYKRAGNSGDGKGKSKKSSSSKTEKKKSTDGAKKGDKS